MAYNQNNSKNNFKRNINRNDVDIKKIISDYETDYSKTAEKVIKTLIEKYGERKILTTSKIRNILAMTADIYNDVNDPSEMKGGILSENIQARIRYLKIRIIYESGRENDVKNFVEESCIVDIINSIGDKKANYIRFSRYMEALVAYRKLQISGKIELITGLHIGGSEAFSAIGAVDSPVVRDTISGLPMIPGSSLRGKMRALLAKMYNQEIKDDPNYDADCLTDIFGRSKGVRKPSKLLFSDMIMTNWEELRSRGLDSKTEVKFENSINRASAVANPRQIERVVRGAEFDLDIIYEMSSIESCTKDMEIIANGFRLLEYDYIGGSGSRGYGKIKFKDLHIDYIIGDEVDESNLDMWRKILK